MAGTIIYVENATVNFSGFKALNEVNLCVDTGELRFLIGPNGAGKTTLLDVICGKIKPASGRVIFQENTDICRLNEYDIARCGISRKFQAPTVFENLTVFENMELCLTTNRELLSSFCHRTTRADREKMLSMLERVGLEEKAGARAGSLAHGQKQWLELAMTIIQEPQLLLVDEPVAGMTGAERFKTGEILLAISKERSVLVVEHDMKFVEQFAKKVTVLHEGRVLCEGTFAYVQNNPVVIDVYLGRGGEAAANAFH
jgi:urea transport system ATP-binding protein